MSAMDTNSLVLCLVCLLIYALKDFIIRTYKCYKINVPTIPGYPILGVIPKLLGNSQEERFKIIFEYSNMFTGLTKVWAGPICMINVNEPTLVQQVLTSDKCWTKSKMVYDQVPFGEGLFTAYNYDNWKIHRRVFSYSFTRRNLLNFVQIFIDSTDTLVKNLSAELGKTFSFYDYIFKCTLEFHLKTLFKIQDYKQFENDGLNTALVQAYENIDYGMAMKLKYPAIYPDTIYKATSLYQTESKSKQLSFTIYRNIIEQHKKYLEEKYFSNDPHKSFEDLKRETFIDQVVYYENQLTKKQIDDHMLSIISPHRTLALQITQAVMMLAMHPDVQEKVYQEIKEVYPNENVPLDYETVQKLDYMDMVIKETMRLFPAIPFILRNTMEEIEVGGQMIPEGVNFFISIYSIQRNKDVWGENANNFDPDNFLPENVAKRHPGAWVPFSLGKRNCVGKQYTNLSFKIILKKLIETYKFSTPMKYEDIRLINDMTLKMANEPLMTIEKR